MQKSTTRAVCAMTCMAVAAAMAFGYTWTVPDAQAKTLPKTRIASAKSKFAGKVTVKAKKVKKAKSYAIAVSTSKKKFWKNVDKMKASKKRTVKASALVMGKTYYVKARGIGKNGKTVSKWSKTVKVKVKYKAPGKPKVTSAKGKSKGKIAVKVSKAARAKGYQAGAFASKSAKKPVAKKACKSKKATIAGLKQGKTYYVRARAWAYKGSKKAYGKWGSPVKVKVPVTVGKMGTGTPGSTASDKPSSESTNKKASVGLYVINDKWGSFTKTRIIMYLKGFNPDTDAFVSEKMKNAGTNTVYGDIQYDKTGRYIDVVDKFRFYRVTGGWITICTTSNAGNVAWKITRKTNGTKKTIASGSIHVKDYDKELKKWVSAQVAKHCTPGMSCREKYNVLESCLWDGWVYCKYSTPTSVPGAGISEAKLAGPFWLHKGGHCVTWTESIQQILECGAVDIGTFKKIEDEDGHTFPAITFSDTGEYSDRDYYDTPGEPECIHNYTPEMIDFSKY